MKRRVVLARILGRPGQRLGLPAPEVGVGATGQYAMFYNVEGTTYWDNNFGLNYSF